MTTEESTCSWMWWGAPPKISYRVGVRDGEVASTETREVCARAAIRRRFDLVIDLIEREADGTELL